MTTGSELRNVRFLAALLLACSAPLSYPEDESPGDRPQGAEDPVIVRLWAPAESATEAFGRSSLTDRRMTVEVDGEERVAYRQPEEEPGSMADAQARDLLVFVDEGSALTAQRDALLSALAARLATSGPGGRLPERKVALVVADTNRIEVVLPWATGAEAIAEGLAELAARPVFGLELRSHLARTAAYRLRGDRGTGRSSFAAVGFSGSGRQVGVPDSRPRIQLELRAARAAAQAAAAVLQYPQAFGLEREVGSAPPAMVLVGGAWDLEDGASGALGGLIFAAQRVGAALFPWRAGEEPNPGEASDEPGPGGAAVLAAATGGRGLSPLGEGWEALEALGHGLALELALPGPPGQTPILELDLRWPQGLAGWAPDRWLVPAPGWRAGWQTVVAHLAGEEMPSGELTARLGESERRSPGRVLVPVQLEVSLQDVALHPAGDCRVGTLEVRIAAEDPWRPLEELHVSRVEVNRLGPRGEGEVEPWEGAVSLTPIRQRLLISVFDPDGGGLWAREIFFEP